jgi:hypothetical protein
MKPGTCIRRTLGTVLVLLVAVLAPSARAASTVQLDSRSFFIQVNASGIAESKTGSGLTFSDSLTKDANGVHASSAQDSTMVDGTTFVVLFKPRAGRWSVTTAEGSPAIERLRVARGLPPLKIDAKVTGKGSRRLLSWKAKGLAGQRLQFVERSGGGANLLTTTKRASGNLRFTPNPRLGSKRTIEAIAFNGATPRSTSTVARYRVPPPPRRKRVRKLKLRNRILSWRAQRGVASYEVALALPGGTTVMRTARRARLKLSGLPTKGTLRVSILAVDAVGRLGPVASARFKLTR